VRDVALRATAQQPDRVPEDGHAGDAVHVVVAVDDDLVVVTDGLGDALRRGEQAGDHGRLVQALEAGAEEAEAVVGLADPAVDQHLRDDRARAQALRQLGGARVRVGHDPLFRVTMHPCHPRLCARRAPSRAWIRL
jgi:hypothetical protein